MLGCAATSFSESTRPFIPGMTTSVTSRSIVRPCASAERLLRPVRRQDVVAEIREEPRDGPPNRVVVLDEENRATTRRACRSRHCDGRGCGRLRSAAGHIDLERRPDAGLAVHADAAARLLDDAEHGRQPEAGSLAELLRGEERLEDACARRLVHAAARVADREEHVRAAKDAGRRGSAVEVDVVRLDRQDSAVGHRVTRVDREVHHDLRQLTGVHRHGSELRIEREAHLDVLAEQAL